MVPLRKRLCCTQYRLLLSTICAEAASLHLRPAAVFENRLGKVWRRESPNPLGHLGAWNWRWLQLRKNLQSPGAIIRVGAVGALKFFRFLKSLEYPELLNIFEVLEVWGIYWGFGFFWRAQNFLDIFFEMFFALLQVLWAFYLYAVGFLKPSIG